MTLLGGDSSGLKSPVRSRLTNQQTPRIVTQRRASEETIKPLDWKNFFIFYIHSFLLLYKAYTVECAGLSTVLLEFCVVVACQLHPLGDSWIAVAEHPHIELHVTVKDVLNPSILYIELQTDVGNLVILR